jgi:hypothetical protein
MGTIGTFVKDNLIAGDFPMVTDFITVATGTGVLARGTLLKADGTKMASGDTPYGVLGEDIDATSADAEATVYLTGEFNKLTLASVTGITLAAADITALRALSIFVKNAIAA